MCQTQVFVAVVFAAFCIANSLARSVKQTYGIYGAIQSLDTPTTVSVLLQQCYAGFALNGCKDLNASAGFRKDYTFETQFTDPNRMNYPFCLQCCTKPVPRTGADETWNLTCPLNDLQRLSVSKGRRTYRFARRETLADKGIVECPMPTRNLSLYLSGVLNCSVTITEDENPPTTFKEVLHLRSVPTAQHRPTGWIMPLVLICLGVTAALAVPLYKGKLRGQRCVHCGSWLVYVNGMCVVCICISCSLQPPPPKIYVTNGKPFTHNNDQQESPPATSEKVFNVPWRKVLHSAKSKLSKGIPTDTNTHG